MGDDLVFGKHKWNNEYTFRQIIDKDLIRTPLTHFGIDLVLGQRIDILASSYDLMFHPIYLEEILTKTKYQGKPLVLGVNTIFKAEEKTPFKENKLLVYIPWSIFLIGVLLTMFKLDGLGFMVDTMLVYILALVGILLIIMWFGTDHPATKNNWNILWMNPLLFLFPFMLKKQSINYFKLMTMLYFGIVISWYIIPQEFTSLSAPLILYLALRYFYRYRSLR